MRKRWSTPWPWGDLTEVAGKIVGGLLYVFAARPGNGKTTWAVSLARSLALAGHRVAYMDDEMGSAGIWSLIVAPECGVTAWDVLQGNASADEIEALRGAVRREQDRDRVRVIAPCGKDVLKVYREHTKDWQPDVVILDYLQSIHQDREKLEGLLGDLREIGREGPAVFALSQIKRAENAQLLDLYVPPNIARIKGAGAIEERGDVVIVCSRSLRTDVTSEEVAEAKKTGDVTSLALPGVMSLQLAKHRWDGAALDRRVKLILREGGLYQYLPEPAKRFGDPEPESYTGDDLIA